MALNKEELQQLDSLLGDRLDKQRSDLEHHFDQRLSIRLHQHQSALMVDIQSLLQQELEDIRTALKRLYKTESEDVGAAYSDIELLKQRIDKLEKELRALK